MEHGGAKHHRERIGEALKDEIATIIEGELGDPRIGLAGVSEVHLSPDGRSARVFVTVEGDDDEAAQTLKGLDAAKNFIRRELTERLRLRQAPELFFQLDRSDQYGARIDELLKRIEQRRK
ncbi:MAG TPA: 30S ribosome-binding factor RbfA [Terriglobales bacterium]|nr:30S ribosome-binding factor RbfA [Terriglobales bacterium]